LLREQVRLAVPPNHPFARRRSVSLADAAQEPFVGLTREDFSDYHRYLASLFASVKNKPRVIEEHDGMTSVRLNATVDAMLTVSASEMAALCR